MRPFLCGLFVLSIVSCTLPAVAEPESAQLSVSGDWQVKVLYDSKEFRVSVPEVSTVRVSGERYESLPRFNPKAGGWVKGAQLKGVQAQETTTPFLLDPISLELRAGIEPNSELYRIGKDYEVDLDWGTFGRTENSGIKEGQSVYASYRYSPLRLDAVVLTADGQMRVRAGVPRSAAPKVPKLEAGDRHLANIWLPGRISKLAPEHLFPLLEEVYPEAAKSSPSAAEQLLPKTMKKIRTHQPITILAWGDSVTDGGYVPDPSRNRWQEQFAARLRQRFPEVRVEMRSEAWGGRNTASYLAEPPGSVHNYKEKVLAVKPDLIVSEFVNDAGLNPQQVEERYGKLLADFKALGIEWILLTPHYVRPDWMGLSRERDIDEDPRPYVAGLRAFAVNHGVALAEGSKRYGRLWRQGIPYTTVMLNSINHPDASGMKLFADALMELFP